MESLILGITIITSLVVTTFIVAYGLFFRWERSVEGRTLMAVAIGQGAIGWLAVLRRVDEMLPESNWEHILPYPIAAAWLVVALVYVHRLVALLSRRDDQED